MQAGAGVGTPHCQQQCDDATQQAAPHLCAAGCDVPHGGVVHDTFRQGPPTAGGLCRRVLCRGVGNQFLYVIAGKAHRLLADDGQGGPRGCV